MPRRTPGPLSCRADGRPANRPPPPSGRSSRPRSALARYGCHAHRLAGRIRRLAGGLADQPAGGCHRAGDLRTRPRRAAGHRAAARLRPRLNEETVRTGTGARTTRARAARRSPKAAQARVGAGVKERNEMTIGRTDDPENLCGATARQAASVFRTGSRTPSGPAVMRRVTGRTHERCRSLVRTLAHALEPKG